MKKLTNKQKFERKKKLYKIHRITTTILSFMCLGLITIGIVGSCSNQKQDHNDTIVNKTKTTNLLNDNVLEYNYLGYDLYRSIEDYEIYNIPHDKHCYCNDLSVYGFVWQSSDTDYYYMITENDNILIEPNYIFSCDFALFGLSSTISGFDYDLTLNSIYAYSYLGGYDNDYFILANNGQNIQLTIFDGQFICNGIIYEKIKVIYANANGVRYGSSTSDYKTNSNDSLLYYFGTQYYKSDGTSVLVHTPRRLMSEDMSYSVYTTERYWVDNSYRNIHIVYENVSPSSNGTIYNDFSYRQLLSIEPSYSMNGASGGNNNALDSTFALISSCFTGFLPILNITIAPGLTLGVLILFPILILIILLVIRLVKK